MTRGRCSTMHARRATAQRTVLLVGRDLHEAERVRRLLPARGGIAHAPSQALCALAGAEVVLFEDRSWPSAEGDPLSETCELTAHWRPSLLLSRPRAELTCPPSDLVSKGTKRSGALLAR